MSSPLTSSTPNSWRVVELGELVAVAYGKALAAGSRSSDGNIPVVGSSGIVGNHNEALVKGSCLVVGRKGAAGATHLINRSSWPIDTAYFIQPPSGLSLTYLYYWLGSQQLGALDRSTAIPSLSRDDLYRVRVPLAPEAEQTRIVTKLEELLSDLDAGVAELKAAQKKLAQYRQSLLKSAVEGQLTADWRKHNRPTETGADLLARILIERRARWEAKQLAKFNEQGKTPPKGWQASYPEPVAPDTSDLPSLPEAWVWSAIGQCFRVAVGATPSRAQADYWNGSIPWVSSGEVRFNRITATKECISLKGMENSSTGINPVGSVLLGMIGEGKTRGQVALLGIPAANNQNCAAIWVSDTEIAPEFVYFWLWSRYEQTRSTSSGNNQPALNKSIVERIPFPLPPLDELMAITESLKVALEHVEQQELAIERSLKQSTAQRKNILRAAFAGQLVPQDPNDEPASALLDRIRVARKESAEVPHRRKIKGRA